MENLLDKTTQLWVKFTGRKINPTDYHWMIGPHGDTDFIADKFVSKLAEEEKLDITSNQPGYGLLDDFSMIGLSDAEMRMIHPEIIHFYEHSFDHQIEFWSEWKGIFKMFGWLLSALFSKRLQQLNLPLSSIDASRGLESQIIKLKKENKTIWTIWYRKLKSNSRVIYSGIYTTCIRNEGEKPMLKIIFPLPNGNATVFMRTTVDNDRSFILYSAGKKFGDEGFYFTLLNKEGKYWAKYVRAMHEKLRVYVDNDNILRADHELSFYGFRFLHLHYKMTRKK